MNTSRLRRTRPLQFSLKTLFVLMLVVAAYFAGMVTEKRRAEKALQQARQEAEAAIQASRQVEEQAKLAEARARDVAKVQAALAAEQLAAARRLQDLRYELRGKNGR
jgi:translation initiation factor 2B subunit (eIF-2B alpha/beta/delta family)